MVFSHDAGILHILLITTLITLFYFHSVEASNMASTQFAIPKADKKPALAGIRTWDPDHNLDIRMML